MVRVIEIIIDALMRDIIITKRYAPTSQLLNGRDIYYRDTALFGCQKTVDRIVELLAYTLLIPRNSLHVV
jgi:DNA topoisomerase VI subunit A